eukprot:5425853-Karenia_brevis.AAC.1
MDCARRMTTQQTAEQKAERKGAPPVVFRMDVSPVLVKWNRLVIMHRIVQSRALTGSFIHYLEDLRVEKENKAFAEYVKTAASKPKDVKKKSEEKTNRTNTLQ